ncbi:MAG: arginine--tRNA ligase [Candidatus Micrarchaeota archaeon]|nr:arginine--tRNA ligase [Candidatus Micrarchaeota archaeon]
MESLFSEIKAELADALLSAAKSAGYEVAESAVSVEESKAFGDVSSSIALKIAKQAKSDPSKVAEKITGKLKLPEYVTTVTRENGFINFHFGRRQFVDLFLNHVVLEETLKPVPVGKRALIEYPSVNPNKPWHIGHLRNALIGDCLSNLYSAAGYDVEREDYIEDLGLQVAELVWWYQSNKPPEQPGKKFDRILGEEYVKVNSYMKNHGDDAKPLVAKVLSLMEQSGTYESKLARDMSQQAATAQYQTAFNFGIYHDVMIWESDIVRERLLEKCLELLKKKGFAKMESEGEYEGCLVINLKESGGGSKELVGLSNSVKVLTRKNGTPTYVAKDIAFHMWKFGILDDTFLYSKFIERQPNGKPIYSTAPAGEKAKFGGADMAVNVIDVRQTHPQTVMRLAFEGIGRKDISDSIKHVAYGEVELESGGLSGRSGNWVGYSADEILGEAIIRARKLITSRFEYQHDEKERIARSVALAAIKFEFLKYGIEKKIVFSWEKALNFEGGSGPYHQYMCARANRIIEEGASIKLKPDTSSINDYEFSLLKRISMAQEIVEKARSEGKPNIVTDYLNSLSSEFSKFYENCPVLKAEEKKQGLRIEITRLFRGTSARMLGLLGIEALSRM